MKGRLASSMIGLVTIALLTATLQSKGTTQSQARGNVTPGDTIGRKVTDQSTFGYAQDASKSTPRCTAVNAPRFTTLTKTSRATKTAATGLFTTDTSQIGESETVTFDAVALTASTRESSITSRGTTTRETTG